MNKVNYKASMGPRHFCRGNAAAQREGVPPGHRFNGATAFLPWKFAAAVGTKRRGTIGFNGATAFLPWKSTLSRTLAPTLARFNGATAFLPWKSESRSVGLAAAHPASMGPRHFCRGNGAAPARSGSHDGRFNGATAFLPWKCSTFQPRRAPVWPLQWGHGISAVEIDRHAERREHAWQASMGPRHFCRGNRSSEFCRPRK